MRKITVPFHTDDRPELDRRDGIVYEEDLVNVNDGTGDNQIQVELDFPDNRYRARIFRGENFETCLSPNNDQVSSELRSLVEDWVANLWRQERDGAAQAAYEAAYNL